MSQILEPYADINDVLRNLLLRDFAEIAGAGTDLRDVEDALPWLHTGFLGGVGGGSGGRLERTSTVDVEIFAGTYAQAVSLSERISAHLLGYPQSIEVDSKLVVIDMVVETRPPVELPWDDSTIRRIGGTYQVTVRR